MKALYIILILVYISQSQPLRTIENNAFGFGEKLEYEIGYKFLKAGTGYFEVASQPVAYKGNQCYDVNFVVKSLSSLEWIYKVRDSYRTLIDVNGIFPWRYAQRIREGN